MTSPQPRPNLAPTAGATHQNDLAPGAPLLRRGRGRRGDLNTTTNNPTTSPQGRGQTKAPQLPGHAPGWKWRKRHAGQTERPWPTDLAPHVNGLCELGWHTDCPQQPLLTTASAGQCSCPCHQLEAAR